MSLKPRVVGALSDGRVVHAVRLAAPGGLEAEVLSFGATIASLHAPLPGGGRAQVLPNPEGLAALEADGAYHARVIGRVANRIGGACFPLGGGIVRLEPNDGAATHHGGRDGWSGRLWRFEVAEPAACVLAYVSPDGEGGFPGAVTARVRIALEGADTLAITWEAATDTPTPMAMTHHLYFNLSGGMESVTLDHTLAVAASSVTAIDPERIPTGDLLPVEGTILDLNLGRRLGELSPDAHPQLALGGGIDLNYVLDRREDAAVLSCAASGLQMRLSTDHPGLQVYGGQGLEPPMTRYGGVALEPQAWPDAVNRPSFPSVILRPGELYRCFARYRFGPIR